MSVSVEIVPSSKSLVMYGDADPASAYSLSGHVSVSLSSPNSIMDRRRTTRVLLQSVIVTFEGQTEIIAWQTGYACSRLCTVSQEIVPPEPMELSNEDHDDDDEPCEWNIIFNLQIPGWLPATSQFTDEGCGIRYTLFAEAKYTFLDDYQSNSWIFGMLCAPFRSRTRVTRSRHTIPLERLELPTAEGLALTTRKLTFLVSSTAPACPGSSARRIPQDVLSGLRLMTTIPEFIDLDRGLLPITVRMRAIGLDAEDCRRIQISAVSADVKQKEMYRTEPSTNYLRRYPLPRSRDQPPNRPLLDPHPVSAAYDIGLAHYGLDDAHTRSFSLVPPHARGPQALGDDNWPFRNDANSNQRSWYTLEITVPFAQGFSQPDPEWSHPNAYILRPTASSPLQSVKHDICIGLICSYTFPDSDEVATEALIFSVPGHFVRFAPDTSLRCQTPPLDTVSQVSEESRPSGVPSMIPSPTYAPTLPAYSQLFDNNGDRKIDYSIPLPLYTPLSSALDESPVISNKSPAVPSTISILV